MGSGAAEIEKSNEKESIAGVYIKELGRDLGKLAKMTPSVFLS